MKIWLSCPPPQGPEILKEVGGIHNFMHWNRSLLTVRVHIVVRRMDVVTDWCAIGISRRQLSLVTLVAVMATPQDSGGFQMVSLLHLAEITEVCRGRE